MVNSSIALWLDLQETEISVSWKPKITTPDSLHQNTIKPALYRKISLGRNINGEIIDYDKMQGCTHVAIGNIPLNKSSYISNWYM